MPSSTQTATLTPSKICCTFTSFTRERWVGPAFEPERFDLRQVNRQLESSVLYL